MWGTVKLVGTSTEKIYSTAKILLADSAQYKKMATAKNPYGDGRAAKRIVQALLWKYNLSDEKPDTFRF